MPLQRFHPTVRSWFSERLGTPEPRVPSQARRRVLVA